MIENHEVHTQTGSQQPPIPLIYILGNSHSGSTLLAFLLSAHPDIINLGEIKSKTWEKERSCSCGQSIHNCAFYTSYFDDFNSSKQAALSGIRRNSPIRMLSRSHISLDVKAREALLQLYQSLQQRLSRLYPAAHYWIDASKSVWMLQAWLQIIPRENIRILWIRRSIPATVSSFVKRGRHFLPSLLSVKVNERIMKGFLKKNNLPFLEVQYDRFYNAYPEEAQRMSAFLGMEIPSTYASHPNHHVIAGNGPTRREFTTGFEGLRKDDVWQTRLTEMQKKIISWIS